MKRITNSSFTLIQVEISSMNKYNTVIRNKKLLTWQIPELHFFMVNVHTPALLIVLGYPELTKYVLLYEELSPQDLCTVYKL